jgi:hypothetical protein
LPAFDIVSMVVVPDFGDELGVARFGRLQCHQENCLTKAAGLDSFFWRKAAASRTLN